MNSHRRRLPVMVEIVALVWSAVAAQVAQADLIVVEDRGSTSALPYYEALDLGGSVGPTPIALGVQAGGGFPVSTPELSPGVVAGRAINAPGMMPLFLVGDDQASQEWLRSRGADLQRIGAMGLVVNVQSAQRLSVVRSWSPRLRLSPVQASDIARRLGLHHYPVLITDTALEQ